MSCSGEWCGVRPQLGVSKMLLTWAGLIFWWQIDLACIVQYSLAVLFLKSIWRPISRCKLSSRYGSKSFCCCKLSVQQNVYVKHLLKTDSTEEMLSLGTGTRSLSAEHLYISRTCHYWRCSASDVLLNFIVLSTIRSSMSVRMEGLRRLCLQDHRDSIINIQDHHREDLEEIDAALFDKHRSVIQNSETEDMCWEDFHARDNATAKFYKERRWLFFYGKISMWNDTHCYHFLPSYMIMWSLSHSPQKSQMQDWTPLFPAGKWDHYVCGGKS